MVGQLVAYSCAMDTNTNLKPANKVSTLLGVFVLSATVSYFTASYVSKSYVEEQAELQKKTAPTDKISMMAAELEKHPLTKSAFEPIAPPKLSLPQVIEGPPRLTTLNIASGEMLHARVTTVWRINEDATLVRAVVDRGSHRSAILLGQVMAVPKNISDDSPITIKLNSIAIGNRSFNIDAYAVAKYGYIKGLRNKASRIDSAVQEVIFTTSVQAIY